MSSPLKVAIAGLGNVGVGVVKILEQHKKLIADRAGREIFITTVLGGDIFKLGFYRSFGLC